MQLILAERYPSSHQNFSSALVIAGLVRLWNGALWVVFIEKIEIEWCFIGGTGSKWVVHYGH